MGKQYYKKDKKAMVYNESTEPRGIYDPVEYVPVSESPLWCYTKQITQGLTAASGVIYNKDETRLFVFNYNEEITQKSYILYRNAWYKVTRVDTQDDYNTEMYVYVEDANDPGLDNGGGSSGGGAGVFG